MFKLLSAVLGLTALAVVALVLAYRGGGNPGTPSHRVIDITVAIAEDGGFQPASISAEAGETLTFRFTSNDVVHGLSIGPGLDLDLGYAAPGQTTEVTVKIDEPGTYTFYCNTWCSLNHWRLRGVLDVRDPDNPDKVLVRDADPVIAALMAEGIDIDASLADTMGSDKVGLSTMFNGIPSAQRGEIVVRTLIVPAKLRDKSWQRSHTPAQGMALLLTRNPSATNGLLADAVAYLWSNGFDSQAQASAASYYGQNCSACHGVNGAGDGIAAPDLAEPPAAFTDPNYLFEMRGDVLYAKIRRGGMGTNMPNFGTLITREETWALVDYLWSLSFRPPSR